MERKTAINLNDDAKSIARIETQIDDTLLRCISWVCSYYKKNKTDDALIHGLPHSAILSPSLAIEALKNAGFSSGLVERRIMDLPVELMPIILLRKNQGACIVISRKIEQLLDGKREVSFQLILPEIGDECIELSIDHLQEIYAGYAIMTKPTADISEQEETLLPEVKKNWLFSTLWNYRRYYRSAAIAALLINILSLASIFFTMNVYDRVVPNQAFVTLWSLAIGVSIAMVFECISRYIRAHLIDIAAKKADLILGSLLFRQALSIRMEYKPISTGTFANQLREYESLRDFVASATLAAISDLPFVLMFIGVIFFISGPLAVIPLLMIPTIIVVSIIIQWPLSRVMKENMRDASLKQGVLIESIDGMETLKSVRGEAFMQRRWENYSALQSANSMKARKYSTMATGVVSFLQQFQTVAIIISGVYLIDNGTFTMGALVATVMLAGRVTAPLGQVVGLAVRYQQAKTALESLNKLMDMPTDRVKSRNYLSSHKITGQITLKDIVFSYPAPPMQPNPEILKGISLSISNGERIAIIGRIGSGKSTLLRVIAQLYLPVKGQMMNEGLDTNQIDPADWRKAVGFVGQDARLFHGTLRENIMIGQPDATASELLRVLKLTGLDAVVSKHPAGINMRVGEMGSGLSGGQRQLASLARTLISRPKMLLLDEPTSSMDSQTESQFVEHLANATQGQTLILVTHRPMLLGLVDRIVVVEDGKIALDGKKEDILRIIGGGNNIK
jgi:ATP-binding cassette subfamily C protein LapB